MFTIDTLVDCGPIQVDFYNDDAGETALDAALFAIELDLLPG